MKTALAGMLRFSAIITSTLTSETVLSLCERLGTAGNISRFMGFLCNSLYLIPPFQKHKALHNVNVHVISHSCQSNNVDSNYKAEVVEYKTAAGKCDHKT
jgi:hypothetical protein